MVKVTEEPKDIRIIGRQIGHVLTDDEIDAVAGGNMPDTTTDPRAPETDPI